MLLRHTSTYFDQLLTAWRDVCLAWDRRGYYADDQSPSYNKVATYYAMKGGAYETESEDLFGSARTRQAESRVALRLMTL